MLILKRVAHSRDVMAHSKDVMAHAGATLVYPRDMRLILDI